MTGIRTTPSPAASAALLARDAVERRSLKSSSDALLRAQLRTGQHFLPPAGVAAAWERLNTATIEGKRA